MPIRFDTLASVYAAPCDDLIDVRSPAEFAEDHIPGALSLPVLSNDERARVGTIYTQQSPFKARKLGAALVARNAARHLEGALADKPGGWRPLVYCWRGGQRSGSFASILSQIGWRAETIEGGYRAYRRLVVGLLHEKPMAYRLVLLDGDTGTGKTELLARVAAMGGQVLDLEALARHRGSIFGGMGEQPSQKAFEGVLAHQINGLDPSRPVLVEAESSRIGGIFIPPSLWGAMRGAGRIRVRAPLAERARYSVAAYAELVENTEKLAEALDRLKPLQGGRIGLWEGLIRAGEYEALAAGLMEHHYDPRYAKARAAHGAEIIEDIAMESLSDTTLDATAKRILARLRGPV